MSRVRTVRPGLPTLVLGLCASALGLGCGASSQQLPVQHRHADGCHTPVTGADGHVEVYLSVLDDDGERPFCPGDHLHASDELQVTIDVVDQAYVHMLYVDPEGESGTLERQDPGETTRQGLYRLPAGLLTRHAGEAQLFLMVSLKPLAEADPMMHELWQTIHDEAGYVDRSGHLHRPARPKPKGTPLHFDASADLHADFDEHGVAMLAISLHAGD